MILIKVTPFVGVWIETCCLQTHGTRNLVTPFVGVWIETEVKKAKDSEDMASHPSWVCGLKHEQLATDNEQHHVTPFVGVWIETSLVGNQKVTTQSHPSWVCGLKLNIVHTVFSNLLSHPSWVCGLKRVCEDCR